VSRHVRSSRLIEAVGHGRLEAVILRDGTAIGAMAFDEYQITRSLSDQEFFDELDSYRFTTWKLAKAILANWSPRTLARLNTSGRVVCFDRLWVKPEPSAAGCWSIAAKAIIERRYLRRYGLMILCPFPLEYEGAGETTGAGRAAFDRRLAAMARMYARQLDVAPLPARPDSGNLFMWRPLRNDAPRPRARRSSAL
jgi:hypothetical protein